MSGKWLLLAVTWCATILTVSAVAQDEKNELGGTFGHAFISDQSITGANFFNPVVHSGSGWSFDAEYARRFLVTPLFGVSGEVVAMYNPDEDLNAGSVANPVVPTVRPEFVLNDLVIPFYSLFVLPVPRHGMSVSRGTTAPGNRPSA